MEGFSRNEVMEEGFTILHLPERPEIDIVFVHGLGGHPYDTWAHQWTEPPPTLPVERPSLQVLQASPPKLDHVLPKSDLFPPKSDPSSSPAITRRDKPTLCDRFRRRSRGSTLNNGSRQKRVTPSAEPQPVPPKTMPQMTAPQKKVQDQVKGIYWIKEFLSTEKGFDKARILVYGYDSKVAKVYANANHNNLFAHAKNLMYALEREKPPRRPVIFVAHSLGGLLIKEALRRSEASEEDEIKDIVRCTKGVIFLGTPHRGSPGMASLGQSVRATASAILRLDTNSTILRSLGTDSPELELGRESFVTLWRKYDFRVKTFQEAWGLLGVNIGPLNHKVVPDTSSTLDDPRERAETISANHMNMCRFRHRLDKDYQNLTAEIRTAILASKKEPELNEDGKKFLGSLEFEGMNNRRDNIQRALDNTCQWLYSTAEYSTWIKRQDLSKNHGLLWIKGKPGSGKSTMMKDALFHAKDQFSESQISTAGFFFNARGTQQLEKTPLGLYRSLLHQVLQQDMLAVHHLTPMYKKKKEFNTDSQWTAQELQDILYRVFATSESRAAMLFIDAMDECNDDEVRDLVRFFKGLATKACSAGARLNICFSSRHYPYISIDQCPELVVEDNNGADILRYIETEAEDNRPIADLKNEIFLKSSGVFLWVVLVIAMLHKRGRGKPSKLLQRKLREIPPELDTLFRTLFHQDETGEEESERSQTICLMQLVLFAREPMTLSQIHAALAFGRHAHDSLRTWKDSVEYLDVAAQRKELVLDLSRGLLEESPSSIDQAKREDAVLDLSGNLREESSSSIDEFARKEFVLDLPENLLDESRPKVGKYSKGEGEPTYQFIHETVREFFLSGEGFRLLGFSPDNVAGSGHLMLAQCCINYLATSECESIARGPNSEEAASGPDFVLLDYISIHIFDHIEAAIQQGAPDDMLRTLIHRLGNKSCQLLLFLQWLRGKTPFLPGSTILMAAIGYDAPASLKYIVDMGFDVNEPSPTSEKYALHMALSSRRWRKMSDFGMIDILLSLLLSLNADVDLKNSFGQTPLHVAATTTAHIVGKLLAESPRVNERDNDGDTPFDRAKLSTERGRVEKLLVEHGARPGLRNFTENRLPY